MSDKLMEQKKKTNTSYLLKLNLKHITSSKIPISKRHRLLIISAIEQVDGLKDKIEDLVCEQNATINQIPERVFHKMECHGE